MKLSPNEEKILRYLKEHPGWHTPTAIAQAIWPGTGRHSSSTSPILKRLVAKGLAERKEPGHYLAK